MADLPRVLFVSKPVVPPWHDGSKNLVRDVASGLVRHRATVLTTMGTEGPPGTDAWPVYEAAGGFAPGLTTNARVFAALARARGFRLWHFVFAPNVASSSAAHLAIASGHLRGLGRVVQTIASRPKRFRGVRALLFGDVVVALSEWTRARLLAEGISNKRLTVIPPCARPLRSVTESERRALRESMGLEGAPLVVYAGDLETSTGAETTAAAVPAILRAVPEARIVFACRKKTTRATEAEDALRASLDRARAASATRFVGELPDLAPLLQEAAVVVFPVDDLYGKVDVPLVVIEALASGIPLVLARGGPLESVTAARFVEPRDADALARVVVELVQNDDARRSLAAEAKELYARKFSPARVVAAYEDAYAG